MFEALDVREPLLINSIGHAAGLLLFSSLLVLLWRGRRGGQRGQRYLPFIAAGLALLWNAGSLAVLAASSGLMPGSDLVVALSFCVLSVLPAVLLQLSLEGRARPIWIAGYVLSAAAAALHLAELAIPDPRVHQVGLWVIVAGFGLLSVAAMIHVRGLSRAARFPARRILASMCLLLFAVSFAHFSPGHERNAWSSEIAIHHAGIPLALYVLLQDYRFLLLDAFFRFVVNAVVACGFVVAALALNARYHILHRAAGNPFLQGSLLVAACLALVALAFVRGRLQLLLTRVVFRRPDREPVVAAIRAAGDRASSERDFLAGAAPLMAAFMAAARCEVRHVETREEHPLPDAPGPAADPPWVEARVPVRFANGDGALILLGRREGGRPYLSEDWRELTRLAEVVAEQVERFRRSEVQRLVAQAELRALQSQINPHFLFNSLNTLYGTIPRESSEARRLVLNLSEVFRYCLHSGRTYIPLSEEMQIVRAYLAIEALRLGGKLRTEIQVDAAAERALIPVLSVQPLVENAVKHGVAARSSPGTVRLRARVSSSGVLVEVGDDGGGFDPAHARAAPAGEGVGLDNVRQRLRLCFGEAAPLNILSTDRGSTVSFLVPNSYAFPAAPGGAPLDAARMVT